MTDIPANQPPADGEPLEVRKDFELLSSETILLHWHIQRVLSTDRYRLYVGAAEYSPELGVNGTWYDLSHAPIGSWEPAGIDSLAQQIAVRVGADIAAYIGPHLAAGLHDVRSSVTASIDAQVDSFAGEIPDTMPDTFLGGDGASPAV